jgi:hypothetical protein
MPSRRFHREHRNLFWPKWKKFWWAVEECPAGKMEKSACSSP